MIPGNRQTFSLYTGSGAAVLNLAEARHAILRDERRMFADNKAFLYFPGKGFFCSPGDSYKAQIMLTKLALLRKAQSMLTKLALLRKALRR